MMYGSVAEALEPLHYGEVYEVCTKVSYQYYYNEDLDLGQTRVLGYSSGACSRYDHCFVLTVTFNGKFNAFILIFEQIIRYNVF